MSFQLISDQPMKSHDGDYVGYVELGDGERAGIRGMRPGDLSKVIALERIHFDDPWSLAHFRHEIMSNKVSWPLVVELGSQLLGYAVTWFVEDEIHLANLAVEPSFRQQGIATELMGLIFAEGIDRGATCAYLEVRNSNSAAIRLYKKCGFEKIGIRPGYYRDGENAVVMRRLIPFTGPHLKRLEKSKRKRNVLV